VRDLGHESGRKRERKQINNSNQVLTSNGDGLQFKENKAFNGRGSSSFIASSLPPPVFFREKKSRGIISERDRLSGDNVEKIALQFQSLMVPHDIEIHSKKESTTTASSLSQSTFYYKSSPSKRDYYHIEHHQQQQQQDVIDFSQEKVKVLYAKSGVSVPLVSETLSSSYSLTSSTSTASSSSSTSCSFPEVS